MYDAAVRIALSVLLAMTLALVAGCDGLSQPQTPKQTVVVALPGPAGAKPLEGATDEPSALPGVKTDDLDDRERRAWWKLVNTLYAPCSDQAVSIRQCVAQERPCAACRPAASLLAAKVHEGAGMDQARALYAIRFGPETKKIEVYDSPSRGPVEAPVTIVVWSDFECPHCRMAMPILDRAVSKLHPKVRVVHKFYPLHQHTYAEGAARAAIAAKNQDKYWEMERLLFEHQSQQTDADLDSYAQQLRLDTKRFRADMSAQKTTEIIARDRADAEKVGLDGTPFIVINGRQFDSSYFHLDSDLEPWLALEIELTSSRARP